MTRLPVPGSDSGAWGAILNEYLLKTHKPDGTLQDNIIGAAQIQDNAVAASSIAGLATVATTGSYNDLSDQPTILATSVNSVNGETGAVVIDKSDMGLGNVDNTSDINKPISTATQTVLDEKEPRWTGTPNGFTNGHSDTTMSFNESSRTLTVAPTGVSFEIWSDGIRYIKTAPDSVVISDVEGIHYIYFDENGVLTDTTTFTELYILRYCAVSMGYWDATNKRAVPSLNNEQHGTRLPPEVHLLNHLALGVVYESGLGIGLNADGDGSVLSDIEFSGGAGYLQDEDNRVHIEQHDSTTNIHVMHMEGPSGYWRTDNTSSALTRTTGSGLAAYNRYTGSAWELAEMTDEYYGISYIYALPGISENWVVVMGQHEYDSINAARSAALLRPVLGALPAPEYKIIGAVVFQTSSTYTNLAKARVISCDNGDYQDWRFIASIGTPEAGGAVDSVNGRTGTVVLTKTEIGLLNIDDTSDANKPISTATQAALDGKQATLASGTNIKTVNGSSVLGSGDLVIAVQPIGAVQMYAGASTPGGWLLCDGSSFDPVVYPALYTIISTTYGGTPSVPLLPNLKGKVAVGRDASQSEFDVLGETGGEKTHTLTIPEMPGHTHIQDAHTHLQANVDYAVTSAVSSLVAAHVLNDFPVNGTATSSTTATNQNTGGGASHNNLQPYIVMNYIIRAA